MNDIEQLRENSDRFNRIVIWGLKKKFHTHRYIFQEYYRVLKKLKIPVIWVEDNKKSQKIIEKNDLIISVDAFGKMIPEKHVLQDYNIPIRNDIYYCLHNFKELFVQELNPKRVLKLAVYQNKSKEHEQIYQGVHIDRVNRILYQPWGTPLLPNEFKKPIFSRFKLVFWVGSIWNNALGQGNLQEIAKLKLVLKEQKLKFINIRFIPKWLNILLIRISRIAPAIGGNYQVKIGYLPCRMFKNISYGQLGFSNIIEFNNIFVGCHKNNEDIASLITNVMKMDKDEYLSMVTKQQEICKNYTYVQHVNNIFKYI